MDNYLTTAEVAKIARVAPSTVRHWRRKGTGPLGTKVGKNVIYSESVIKEWLKPKAETDAVA